MGDLADAETRYRSTLRCDPAHATALARLASLLRAALPQPDLDALHRGSPSPTSRRFDRANLRFALALVHDGRGQVADAAACLEQANAIALDELGAGVVPTTRRSTGASSTA